MNKIAENQILLQKLPRPRVPFKLLLIMGFVLTIAVSFVVSSNIRHDQERVQAAMKNRADVLIWALEGGVRSMAPEGRGGPARQTLVEEVAKQPAIAYLAITDRAGTILVHSNPEKVGTKLYSAQEMQKYYNLAASQGYFTHYDRKEIYEVAKLFVPILPTMGKGHGHNGGFGMGHSFSTVPEMPARLDKKNLAGARETSVSPQTHSNPSTPVAPGTSVVHGTHASPKPQALPGSSIAPVSSGSLEAGGVDASNEHSGPAGIDGPAASPTPATPLGIDGPASMGSPGGPASMGSPGGMCNTLGMAGSAFGKSLYGQAQAARDYYIFVGIDAQPFEAVFKDNVISSVLLAFFIVLACLSGLVLFFFIQNYKASRLMLQDAQTLTLQVFESLPIGVFTINQQGTFTLFNRHSASMLNITGSSKTVRSIYDYPLTDWKGLIDELEKGLPIVDRELELGAWNNGNKPEKITPVSLSASKISGSGQAGYLFLLRDLGEVRSLQKQIRLNERLTALGNLAAGVAHEIRNPLSSIKGYATYLLEKLRGDEAAFTTAQMMIQEVERLNRVVSELLGVAKAGELALQEASLLPVLQRAIRLVSPEAEEKGVVLQFDQAGLEEGDTLVQVDGDKFIQALLNLLINAVQATPPGKAVRLVMAQASLNHVQNQGFDLASEENTPKTTGNQKSPVYTPSSPRDVLLISVNDDGPGMSFEVLSKIFTPYFSTKPQGTGLGLTIAHQIIEQHGGEIKVQSLPGKGSQFTIILPLAKPLNSKEAHEQK